MEPLLSIIIPTKNRYEYLTHLVGYFSSLNDTRMEFVIQDNSDNKSEEFINRLNELNDDRVKYFHHQGHISVVDNCDKAILNSTGEYVCMLGDDDGFMPELIEWVVKMKGKEIDVLLPEKANYAWADIVNKHHKFSGLLSYKKHDENLVEIDVQKELDNVLSYGGTFMFNMPRLYHAVVSRAVLNKIFEKTNSFFPGPSPDMANAIALCLLNPKTYYVNKPIIISGKGFKSTGGQGLRHGHIGKIEDIKHLPANTAADWEKNIPRIWTGQTIYAESIIKSLRRNGREDLIKRFNYLRNYTNFAGKHLNLFKLVQPYIKWYQYPAFTYYMLSFMKLRAGLFIENKFKTSGKKTTNLIAINDLPNIQAAITTLEARLK